MRWVDMRKGVAYLFRYRDVSLPANSRYLSALAEVDNPTDAIRTLDRITTRKQLATKGSAKAFNPLARAETQIFRALLDGQHMIHGFSNPDIRNKLKDSPHLKDIADPRRQSARVHRLRDGWGSPLKQIIIRKNSRPTNPSANQIAFSRDL